MYEFDLILQRIPGLEGSFVVLPELSELEPLGRASMCVEFDGLPCRAMVALIGKYGLLGVPRQLVKKLGKEAGASVHVRLWRDDVPRILELPSEISDFLSKHPDALERYQNMNVAMRTAMMMPVHAAFGAEQREKRIAAVIAQLSGEE